MGIIEGSIPAKYVFAKMIWRIKIRTHENEYQVALTVNLVLQICTSEDNFVEVGLIG